jgi:hypothetical protein
MTTNTIHTIAHVAGSAFALHLSTTTSPISIAGVPDPEVGDWAIELVLKGRTQRLVVPGAWVTSAAPEWAVACGVDDTTAWPVGDYAVRIAYVSPEAPSRRFEMPTNLVLEVTR